VNEMLPEGWVETDFSTLNFHRPKSIDPAKNPETQYELYSVPSFPSGKPEILKGRDIGSSKQVVEPGDVLVCKINPRINRVWQVADYSGRPQIASSEWIIMRSRYLSSDYLRYQFTENKFRKLICTDLTGVGGSLTRAQPKRVATFPVRIAPFSEQKRIDEKLECLLAKVDACKARLERVPEIIKRFRQSVLADAVSGKLTADWRENNKNSDSSEILNQIRIERKSWWTQSKQTGYSEPARLCETQAPFQLPGSWGWMRAEEACQLITKGATPSKDKMNPGSGEIPFIKVYNLTFTGRLDFSIEPTFISTETNKKELRRSQVFPGDVLMNIVGPPLGKISIVPKMFPIWNINQAIAIFRPMRSLSNKYLAYYLSLAKTIEMSVRKSKATAGQSNLTLQICRDLPIPIPTANEQIEIVNRIDVLFSWADQIAEKVKNSKYRVGNLISSILSKAFRGELSFQDPNDDAADQLLNRIKAERDLLVANKIKIKNETQNRCRKMNKSTR
jgi:type I restriction enzyme, S subunit